MGRRLMPMLCGFRLQRQCRRVGGGKKNPLRQDTEPKDAARKRNFSVLKCSEAPKTFRRLA